MISKPKKKTEGRRGKREGQPGPGQLELKKPLLRSSELADAGYHYEWIRRQVKNGLLERVSRGVYRVSDREASSRMGLAIVAKASPRAVVCLLSALSFHGIGTWLPSEVWIALARTTRRPAIEYPPTRVVWFGGPALTRGIETHEVDGVEVRVYAIAKTIADCFKYRNKIGLDVALEALKDAWRSGRVTMAEIDTYARICRVRRVMSPYLQALVGWVG